MRPCLLLAGLLAVAAHAPRGVQAAPPGAVRGAAPEAAALPTFRLGFNQGWWFTHYGRQWVTDDFDADHVRGLVRATARFAGEGAVLRVWLFEGADPGGVLWDGEPAPGAPAPGDRHRTRPTGLDPRLMETLRVFLEACQASGVQAYLTLFDGNVSDFGPGPHRKTEYWNVLNEGYGAGAGFRDQVLGPVLELAGEYPDALFGLDLVNEVNNLVADGWFQGGWTGAVRFVRRWRTFVRARLPGLPVTASLGHHTATQELLRGALPRGVVDFYDLHLYSDSGRIPREADLRRLAREVPVYLGEFGQRARRFDDELQRRVTAAYVRGAHRVGLRGAFAWRLRDVRPGHNPEARHSFYAKKRWRPAAAAMARLRAELP